MELTGTARLRARWPTAKVFLARRRRDWILGIFHNAVMLTDFLRGWAMRLLLDRPGIIFAICGFCWRSDRPGGDCRDTDGALKCAATLRTALAVRRLNCSARRFTKAKEPAGRRRYKGDGSRSCCAYFFLGALSC